MSHWDSFKVYCTVFNNTKEHGLALFNLQAAADDFKNDFVRPAFHIRPTHHSAVLLEQDIAHWEFQGHVQYLPTKHQCSDFSVLQT